MQIITCDICGDVITASNCRIAIQYQGVQYDFCGWLCVKAAAQDHIILAKEDFNEPI